PHHTPPHFPYTTLFRSKSSMSAAPPVAACPPAATLRLPPPAPNPTPLAATLSGTAPPNKTLPPGLESTVSVPNGSRTKHTQQSPDRKSTRLNSSHLVIS